MKTFLFPISIGEGGLIIISSSGPTLVPANMRNTQKASSNRLRMLIPVKRPIVPPGEGYYICHCGHVGYIDQMIKSHQSLIHCPRMRPSDPCEFLSRSDWPVGTARWQHSASLGGTRPHCRYQPEKEAVIKIIVNKDTYKACVLHPVHPLLVSQHELVGLCVFGLPKVVKIVFVLAENIHVQSSGGNGVAVPVTIKIIDNNSLA